MKYALYVALLYIFLPFNLHIDLIAVLLFFIVFKEDERFVLLFSFFAGLLVDLYDPVVIGINLLIYLSLVQILLYIKKYIAQSNLVTFSVFATFYLTKIVIIHVALSISPKIQPAIITLLFFFPIFLLLNKLVYKVWMKT